MQAETISSPWVLIVTSAAIGAVVSSLITLLGQVLERRARRTHLLLEQAIMLAIRQSDIAMKGADNRSGGVSLWDDIVRTEDFYKKLEHLIRKGELPADAPMPQV